MSHRKENGPAVIIRRGLKPATTPDIRLAAGRSPGETLHGGLGATPAGLPLS